jgi:histidine ammonia-lyase
MEFLRPLRSSRPLETIRRAFRRVVKPWRSDRILARDLETSRLFLDGEAVSRLARELR